MCPRGKLKLLQKGGGAATQSPPATILGNFGNSKRTMPARPAIRVRTARQQATWPHNLPVVWMFPPSVCKAAYMVVVVWDDTVVVTRDVDKRVDKRWSYGVNMRVVIEMW